MIGLATLSLIFLVVVSTPLIFAQEETFDPVEFVDPFFRPTQEGLSAFFTGLGEPVPKIIGALIVLVVGVGISFAVKRGLKYSLIGVFSIPKLKDLTKVDPSKIGKKGSEGWTKLINQIPEMFFWFTFAFFFIFVLNTLGLDQASDAMTMFWVYFPRIIGAIIFLIAGFIAERIIINSIESSKSPYFGKESGIKIPIQVIIYSVVIAVAVTQLGIGSEIIPILVWSIGIGIMGAFAIAFGLGGRYFVIDLVSLWSLNKLGIKVGVQIEYDVLGFLTEGKLSRSSDKVKGTIIDMSTNHLKIKENDKTIIIPTQSIFSTKVTVIKEANKEDDKD